MKVEYKIFEKSLADFLTKDMLKFSLIPLILTMIFLYMMFFSFASYGISSLQEIANAAQNGQDIIIDENAPFYINWLTYFVVFLFKYSFVSSLAGFLFYALGAVVVLKISVLLSIAIIGFLTPYILDIIHKRHYSHLTLHGHSDLLSPLWLLLKSGFVMIILFILFVPLYFVPIINIVAFSFPFYYFFHKLLNYDVSSTLLSKDEFRIIYKKEAMNFRLRTLFLYIVSMIPLVTLFTVVFYIIYLGHAYLLELTSLYQSNKEEEKEDIKSIEEMKKLNYK